MYYMNIIIPAYLPILDSLPWRYSKPLRMFTRSFVLPEWTSAPCSRDNTAGWLATSWATRLRSISASWRILTSGKLSVGTWHVVIRGFEDSDSVLCGSNIPWHMYSRCGTSPCSTQHAHKSDTIPILVLVLLLPWRKDSRLRMLIGVSRWLKIVCKTYIQTWHTCIESLI